MNYSRFSKYSKNIFCSKFKTSFPDVSRRSSFYSSELIRESGSSFVDLNRHGLGRPNYISYSLRVCQVLAVPGFLLFAGSLLICAHDMIEVAPGQGLGVSFCSRVGLVFSA